MSDLAPDVIWACDVLDDWSDAICADFLPENDYLFHEYVRADIHAAAQDEIARLRRIASALESALRDVSGMLDDPTGSEHVRSEMMIKGSRHEWSKKDRRPC